MRKTQNRDQGMLFPSIENTSPLSVVDSPFGSLQDYSAEYGRNVWGCDIGNTMWFVSKNGAFDSKISLSSFLLLPFCDDGDLLLVENAHMQPQKEAGSRSLAQVYLYRDLKGLQARAKSRNIEIRLVPHGMTPKMRLAVTGTDRKTDEIDCAVVSSHVLMKGGSAALQRFNPRPIGEWSAKELYAQKAVREMNVTINNQRLFKRSDDESPETIPELKQLYSIFFRLEQSLRQSSIDSEPAADAVKWIVNDVENPALVALWVAVYGKDCQLRKFEWSNRPLGANYIWRYLLGNKPNHFKAGVARSNICYWTFKALVKKEIKNEGKITVDPSDPDRAEMLLLRARFRKACFVVMREMQELVIE